MAEEAGLASKNYVLQQLVFLHVFKRIVLLAIYARSSSPPAAPFHPPSYCALPSTAAGPKHAPYTCTMNRRGRGQGDTKGGPGGGADVDEYVYARPRVGVAGCRGVRQCHNAVMKCSPGNQSALLDAGRISTQRCNMLADKGLRGWWHIQLHCTRTNPRR